MVMPLCNCGAPGGFNWSSQHLILEVVMGRPAGWMRVDGQGADEVAGAADASSGSRAAVLA